MTKHWWKRAKTLKHPGKELAYDEIDAVMADFSEPSLAEKMGWNFDFTENPPAPPSTSETSAEPFTSVNQENDHAHNRK